MSTLPPDDGASSGSEPLDLFASAGVSPEGRPLEGRPVDDAPRAADVEAQADATGAPDTEPSADAAPAPAPDADAPAGRETFAVGRLDRRTSELQMVNPDPADAPFPGPWSLKAVVKERGPDLRIVR